MSVVNRIIVTCRLDNGDGIDVSAKAINRGFTQEEFEHVRAQIKKEFTPCRDDTLYYHVRARSGINGRDRRNWSRVLTLEELDKVVREVMVPDNEAVAS